MPWVIQLFMGSFSLSLSLSFFSLSGYPTVWINSLRLSSGYSGPVPTLSNAARASMFSPHLLVVDARVWVTSPLGNLWVLFIYLFSLTVMLLSEIPKLPTDLPVRGFPGVWKFPQFYDSLPGTDLHP